MKILLSALPILLLLILMTAFRWSGRRAGVVSWLAALVIAAVFFGLTPQVFVVSQIKGLVFSLYVLAVLWPALLLYNLNVQVGGIQALTGWLGKLLPDRSLLIILLAWPFSSILEGVAGFGLPIAVAAPMLVSLGVSPLLAVVASAIGHTWAVTFGNMGAVFQSLITLSGFSEAEMIPFVAVMMGLACVLCGLAVIKVLNEMRHWKIVLFLGLMMAVLQYLLAWIGLSPLASFGASLSGLTLGILIGRRGSQTEKIQTIPALWATLGSYGFVTLLSLAVYMKGPLRELVFPILWRASFPEVITRSGFITPAGFGQTFRWFAHPGILILITVGVCLPIFSHFRLARQDTLTKAFQATFHSAFPATVGILATVGLSMMLDHTGMIQLLAQAISDLTGRAFPFISPMIGMVGVFATGSNTNSNVLFVSLQKQVAGFIGILPIILVASQTTGGSLGSMISPAKLIVGCSTVGLMGQEGQVLRRTLPYCLGIGLTVGGAAWLMARFF